MNDLNVDNKKLIDAMKMMRENPTEIVKWISWTGFCS